MKVLVCGGRRYSSIEKVDQVLSTIHEDGVISHLIEGGAEGADTIARTWAQGVGVQTVTCKANWEQFGKSAGPRRNANMLSLGPDLVVAFPGGAGTAHMVGVAKAAGIRVMEVPAHEPGDVL